MGSGKSTVGRALAEYLKWNFVDLDHQIELETGKRVSEIFNELGEDEFRALESRLLMQTLDRLTPSNRIVIALGGGAFVQPVIQRKILDSHHPTVFLDAH